MNFKESIIRSNLFISIAAVFLTLETQVQLGMRPQAHPYLFIIFFSTLFEYNLHRLITIITKPEALLDEKHSWVKNNRTFFYTIVVLSMFGFLISIALAKKEVILALAPIALITVFYSLPVFKKNVYLFRLREIPFLKIFLISFVWSSVTVLLPVIQTKQVYHLNNLLLLLAERFLFVFAITIPFDIRDMNADRRSGLKTIPVVLGEKTSIQLSNITLSCFLILCFVHYFPIRQWAILIAMNLSALSTMVFINCGKIRRMNFYYYGILDGTMLLQGILTISLYFLTFFKV